MNKDRLKAMHRRQLQSLGFAMYETALYLDTHPEDKNALAVFDRYNEMYKRATEEYSKAYGPLTISDTTNAKEHGVWQWATEPWPWQSEEE